MQTPRYVGGYVGGKRQVERMMEENLTELKLSTGVSIAALPLKLSKPDASCIHYLSLNSFPYRPCAENDPCALKLRGLKEDNFRSSDLTVIKREALHLVEDDELSSRAQGKKLRLSKHQAEVLEEKFREQADPRQKNDLAHRLNLRPRQVEVWFQNRRARSKLKRIEVERENMRRWCESLTEEKARLEREVQQLRAIKIPEQEMGMEGFYRPSSSSAATLSLCSSCASNARRAFGSV